MTHIDEIMTAGSRVRRVAFGAGDYSLDLGVTWSRLEKECAHARDVIVTASRAHGLEPPLDSVFPRLEDPEGLNLSAQAAVELGYQGKMCIHPDQIGPVNACFTPSEEEIAFSRKVVEGFAQAEKEGSAAFRIDGKFVDYPILYRAQRVLKTMEDIQSRQGAS